MRIAAITITMNDYHVITQWKEFSEQYKNELYKHIIVHNTANKDYEKLIEETFTESIILKRNTNGGTTGAYNTGIKEALKDPDVDAIMLIANDIKISSTSIIALCRLLNSNNNIGAVAPILLEKDDKTIVAFGEMITKNAGLDRLYHNQVLNANLPETVECECLPGGMNMVKREVYEKIGLQDESLFMYCDENDFFIRVGNSGYRIIATSKALSSHCHIYTEGTKNDNSLAWYYINRNHLLVCKKYKSFGATLSLFLNRFFYNGVKNSVSFLLDKTPRKIYYYYLGLIHGVLGVKNNNLVKK
ncbi:glycosyltransferase family 2 protein [Owenweeksia hongkongensis]|uniref:glycosyltransferase family 2 protein n=1 Tax=Owenweeksia hongkongensis TaxID=253245 RepID=UPI003A94F377